MLYEVRCLKSNEDMILALAGQFKQLSHEPETFRGLEPMTSAMPVQCSNQLSYEVTQLRAEVMGSNPVESPECFSVFFFPCYLGIPLRGKRTLVVFSKFRFFLSK